MYLRVKGLDEAKGFNPGNYTSRRLIQEPEEVKRAKRKMKVKFEQMEKRIYHATGESDKLTQVSLAALVETPSERSNVIGHHTNQKGQGDKVTNKSCEQNVIMVNVKEADIAPVNSGGGKPIDWKWSKDELERITAMFCVETPEQALIRRSKANSRKISSENETAKSGKLFLTTFHDSTSKEDMIIAGDRMGKSKRRKQEQKKVTKFVKIHPCDTAEEDIKPMPRSKEDLERIAAMFCVETPEQAYKRRLLKQVNEEEDDCFLKPGIWSCDFPIPKLITVKPVADDISNDITVNKMEKRMSKKTVNDEAGTTNLKKKSRYRIVNFFRNIFRRK